MNPTFSRRTAVRPASFSVDVSTPSITTRPAVGKSMAPARFSSVDFPQPLRPTRATNSPRLTSSETIAITYDGAFASQRARGGAQQQGNRTFAGSRAAAALCLFLFESPATFLPLFFCLSDCFLNRRSDFRRIRRNSRLEAREHVPIRPDQEFCEIPLNLAARLW